MLRWFGRNIDLKRQGFLRYLDFVPDLAGVGTVHVGDDDSTYDAYKNDAVAIARPMP